MIRAGIVQGQCIGSGQTSQFEQFDASIANLTAAHCYLRVGYADGVVTTTARDGQPVHVARSATGVIHGDSVDVSNDKVIAVRSIRAIQTDRTSPTRDLVGVDAGTPVERDSLNTRQAQ